MKAARTADYGTTPMVQDIPVPHLDPEEVLVRIAGASLNPLEAKMPSGVMRDFFPTAFPYTMGTDVDGTVVQVGTSVSDWHESDAVVARADPMRGGAIAEFVAVPAALLVKAPLSLPIEQAAGIPTIGGTAWQALHEIAEVSRG